MTKYDIILVIATIYNIHERTNNMYQYEKQWSQKALAKSLCKLKKLWMSVDPVNFNTLGVKP